MPKPILREGVYEELRNRIVGGRMAPGSDIDEVNLAAELGVSRLPLREALLRLSHEGFVEYLPHRGTRVTTITPSMIREVFQIREALEGIAAAEAARKIDPDHLVSLRARFDALRPAVYAGCYEDVGDGIHEEIFLAAGNQRLMTLMAVYRSQVTWLQRVAAAVPGRLLRAFREHESILCALESRDPDSAESMTRAHIRNTLQDLLAAPAGESAQGDGNSNCSGGTT